MRGTIDVSGTCPAGHERTTPSGALDALAGPSYDSLHKIRLLSSDLGAALTRALATPAILGDAMCAQL